MVRLTHAIKLFQPWSTEIVEGNLNFLIRSFNTYKRERIGIYNTRKIDENWYKNANNNMIKKLWKKQGIIGSVEIKDCISLEKKKIKDTLVELANKEYYDYYPKHLIPDNNLLHIWVFDEAKKWKNPLKIKKLGMCWIKIDIDDE